MSWRAELVMDAVNEGNLNKAVRIGRIIYRNGISAADNGRETEKLVEMMANGQLTGEEASRMLTRIVRRKIWAP
jgi:hypothetical protein